MNFSLLPIRFFKHLRWLAGAFILIGLGLFLGGGVAGMAWMQARNGR